MSLRARVGRRPRARALCLAVGACFPALVALAGPPAASAGLHQDVAFSDYSPLAGSSELMRRLLSPLARAQAAQALARSGKRLLEQPIDLTQETFSVYVPQRAPPPRGYALLVFVPPWQDARLPAGWARVLDENGMIFVSAARSGNEEDVVGRREPLALLAAHNLMQRYAVDPERVYVGGFSGGSRIALRLALAYPDLFRGALLNAGSDPLDAAALPPKELFLRFQEDSRIVYLTGERDRRPLDTDGASRRSLHRWCVFDVASEVTRGAGHEVAGPAALSRALHLLLTPAAPAAPDQGKLAACRADIEHALAARLQKVEALMAAGERSEAQKQLADIDRRFGGLAAPRSTELQTQLN